MSTTAADEGHLRSGSTLSDTATLTSNTPQSSAFIKPGVLPVKEGSITNGGPTPVVIPPEHAARTLVLCFDGTGDQFDADNSSVIEFFSMLAKDDPDRQMVYYQAGIGTYTPPQIATPLFAKFSKTLDEAIAWNLDAHIMGGYEFLMQNYKGGDRICIFGFSRGAYTARCLAGMIHKIGLLPACNHQQIPFAYKMYTRPDELGWKQSNAFKRAFSIDVDIEFVGVWDTVNSVGLIPRRLPFTTSNTIVRTFRHAVSLDERRAKFKANLWNRPNDDEKTLSVTDQHVELIKQKAGPHPSKSRLHALERQYGVERLKATDIDEVWFAGCHCDVGGGSVANGAKPVLARIPLRWMIRETFKRETGIMFHADGLKLIGLSPSSLYPLVLPRPLALPVPATLSLLPIPKTPEEPIYDAAEAFPTESEEELDLHDALAPIYDQLKLSWWWWILEIIPLKQRRQRSDDVWVTWFAWNWGRGRVIPGQGKKGVRVHRSVKMRMDAQGGYRPKANLDLGRVTWVD
ncbi:uncharacterized protein LACBIDRAFT_312561 [Laccaria bicolor S238N-H82]|uniref:Predicted protein n=1 Tax=Laccaria bicolor (strain S238N-H82 / ATCC MYA-4686) TaxID=486041 RepID=B0DWE4_LACBS|nr:uncharacterized protein LACBIDRAFT_312561 [Laccaria bicolor S238N-H82]EDR01075.1 predicted protein [Laccaria bicolor S238N-H82]|eukprot:XP_001888294.1 predicted protein [Laccaria bicolor S238N-H82]